MPLLAANSVIGFIPTQDFARARAFYEGVLGLKATSVWEGKDESFGNAFIEYDIGPDTLAIGKGAPSFKPASPL